MYFIEALFVSSTLIEIYSHSSDKDWRVKEYAFRATVKSVKGTENPSLPCVGTFQATRAHEISRLTMPSFHMSLKRLAQSCSFPHGIAITYLERTLTVPSMTDSMNWYSCQENELGFLHTVFSFQF